MTDKIKEIITRSVNERGEILYSLEEQLFLISEYIKEKKGFYPPKPLVVDNNMHDVFLFNSAFTTSVNYFTNKLNENE